MNTVTIVYGSIIILSVATLAEVGLTFANTRSIDRLDQKLEGLEDNAHDSGAGDRE